MKAVWVLPSKTHHFRVGMHVRLGGKLGQVVALADTSRLVMVRPLGWWERAYWWMRKAARAVRRWCGRSW